MASPFVGEPRHATRGRRRRTTNKVARDLGRKLASDGGKVHVVHWGVDESFNVEPPIGTLDEPLLDTYRLPETPLALCLAQTGRRRTWQPCSQD